MTLLDTHPERFGWRYWTVLAGPEQPARLMSPWLARVFNGPRIDAECPHGNQPPSPDCWCGLHYVPYAHSPVFFPWIEQVHHRPGNWSKSAVTLGVALGDIKDDADDRGSSYRAKRAQGYLILAIFIHEDDEQHADDLRRRHGTPVLVGVSERKCRAMRPVDDDGQYPVRPSWFTKLQRQPAWPMDGPGQRFNETMAMVDDNTPSGMGHFAGLPAHIQELLLHQAGIETAAAFGLAFAQQYPDLAGCSEPLPDFVGLRDAHRYVQKG